MLSTQTRLQAEAICTKIATGQPVELRDMVWLEKWAKAHRSVRDMLAWSRRRAINGVPEPGTLDDLLDRLNLGEPDPARHLDSSSSVDDLANFFKSDNIDDQDRLRRD
jgi:hypothetical protein